MCFCTQIESQSPSLPPGSNVPAPPPAANATRDDPTSHGVYKSFCYSQEYQATAQSYGLFR